MNNVIFYAKEGFRPQTATEGAAGFDMRADIDEPIKIRPGGSVIIPLGVKAVLNSGFVMFLFPRSSMGFKYDTTLSNSVGVIDSDYRGEIKAKIINHGKLAITVKPHQRIVQGVIVQHETDAAYADWIEEAQEEHPTERGEGGMGSTGDVAIQKPAIQPVSGAVNA